ncbi:MAG: hypothetical protein RR066_04535 [Mucinivorans sp.]
MKSDRQNPIVTMLLLLLLGGLFWGSNLLSAAPAVASEELLTSRGTPLSGVINCFVGRYYWLSIALSIFLAFNISFRVARLTVRNVRFLDRSYMPALVFMIICCGCFISVHMLVPMMAVSMIIRASKWLFRSYSLKSSAAGVCLVAGAYYGLAVSIFAPALYLVPVLFVGIAMFRLFNCREWLSALGGVALPLLCSGYVAWLMGQSWCSTYCDFVNELFKNNNLWGFITHITWLDMAFFGSTSALVILSVIKFLKRGKGNSPKAYKAYIYFMWILLAVIVVLVLSPSGSYLMMPLLALPCAVLIPTLFAGRIPGFWPNFLYSLLVISAVASTVLPLIIANL